MKHSFLIVKEVRTWRSKDVVVCEEVVEVAS